MTPRETPCLHVLRTFVRRDGDDIHETCQLCPAHLITNRIIRRTRVEDQ